MSPTRRISNQKSNENT